jgi:UDP-4-amino-4,6-dideoxy-N-acetyl-beta-L-altrosamine transaminase
VSAGGPDRAPIPYGRHDIDEDDVAAVIEVLRHGWLTQGPEVAAFETDLATRCGARHAVAVSSGTAALHLAILAARVGEGDELVAPAVSFLATANCGVYTGAEPRFSDVDPGSCLMTPELLEPALGPRTRAVLPVHFAGLPCDMPAIAELVRERCPDAVIVEDASHAIGASHADGSPVGSQTWADMVVFSFHPVKHVAAGEGGAILTDSDELAARLRALRSHGMTKDPSLLDRPDEGPWYYEMHEVGMNYRISDLNCALARSQLRKLDRFVERRRERAQVYHDAFRDTPHLRTPPPADVARSSWHIYAPHFDFAAAGTTRRAVVEALRSRGVLTQVHYHPIPLQPYYRRRSGYVDGDFPGAEQHYATTLTLPLFASLSEEDQEHVVDAVREVLG